MKYGDDSRFIDPWGTLNFHLPLRRLSQTSGLKFFTLFFFLWGGGGGGGGGKGQTLFKFVCLFQVKFNFSIENNLLRVV